MMKPFIRAILPYLAILSLLSASIAAQDFSQADKLPLPDRGIVRFEGSGLGMMGYSRSLGLILFRRIGSADGIGGNPPIDYIFVDPLSGQIVREIPVNFNVYSRDVDLEDEDAMAALERENEEMAAAAEEEIARIRDLDDRSYTDFLGGTATAVRCLNREELEDGGAGQGSFRYYIQDRETLWIKPLMDAVESAYYPEAVSAGEVTMTGGGKMIMLEFRRSPVMEFDTGSQILIILDPEQSAQFFNEVGYALYEAKSWRAARSVFSKALYCFPDHVRAAYNAACMSALLGDVKGGLHYLGALARIKKEGSEGNSALAAKYLDKVDKDSDFNPIRSMPEFVKGLKAIRGR